MVRDDEYVTDGSGGTTTRLRSEIDPLEDAIYGNFHRKMRREEKLMLTLERNDVLSEVDTLNHNLQLLQQYDWMRHLPSITRIDDPNDYDELESKKNLTIIEINKILRKYDNWKRRYDKLTNDIRTFNQNPHPNDSYEQDEYSIPVAQLRQRRLMQKRKLLGPIIKLRLNNGHVIIYDPEKPSVSVKEDELCSNQKAISACSPRSTSASKSASKSSNVKKKHQITSSTSSRRKRKDDEYSSAISTPTEYQGYRIQQTQQVDPVDLESMEPKLVQKLNFANDKLHNITLGLDLPLTGYQDFQLYRGWLVKAYDFLNQRMSLREQLDRLIPDSQEYTGP
ncbi:uncharacterized protein KQ657_003420 [Scheffersomyces spartinae]|uniref:Something about silencing protein 4 domain-containing protein n=1 Tax=Scheffersomyces spartinae TaxID=45513 RepID=A0A9P7VD61_9ASCO|nr:uncharacterized protein KQ657_003420 [Scheffersomyces spartinae]KAG7195650.1 hypothetical protein KQ657_003420 [Scheffersomyces spartinae]